MLEELYCAGTSYQATTEPCGPCIETSFFRVGEDQNEVEPAIELRWSGFQLLDSTSLLKDIMTQANLGEFAVCGGGWLLIRSAFTEGDPKEMLDRESQMKLSQLICRLFGKEYIWGFPVIIDWITVEPLIEKDYIGYQVSLATPITEELYRKYLFLREAELKAAKLAAVKNNIGFETSEGRTLQ